MSKCRALRYFCLSICLGFVSSTAVAEPPSYVPGRILVLPRAGATVRGDFQRALQRQGVRSVRVLEKLGVHVVQVPVNTEKAMVKQMSKVREVAFAELDMVASPDLAINDPSVGQQWHIAKMHVPEALDMATGSGITVAVLDTGVLATHQDLASKMVLPGYNAVDGSSNTSDIFGHGTAVAGVIAAVTNNSVGVAGVAADARILPVRVTNKTNGQAYCSDISRGLVWAADHGARVANVSYGVMGCATLYSAGQYMMSKGGLVTVSAGNENRDYGIADTPYIITVAATANTDTKASFSCFGNMVDVTAPGLNILTTSKNGGYAAVSGTSFSSPATAGVIALLFSLNPELTPSQVEGVLERSAVDLGTVGWDRYYGYGRVDALRALNESTSPITLDVTPPEVVISSPVSGAQVSGKILVEVSVEDATAIQSVQLYRGTTLVGTDKNEPYQYYIDTSILAAGDLKLVAKAQDMNRNVGVSAEVVLTVKDVIAPSVAISGLRSGSVVTKYVVNVGSTATDATGVKVMALKLDGVSLCTGNFNSTRVAGYCRWNPTTVAKGAHTLTLTASDAANNVGTTSIRVYRQ